VDEIDAAGNVTGLWRGSWAAGWELMNPVIIGEMR
jgi:hypothetical protein